MSGPASARRNPRSLSKQRLRLWLQMLRATRSVEVEVRDRLRSRLGTTMPRFDVMAALYRWPKGLTMTELSRELMVSNGNVTGIINRLVADGMIIRVPNAQDRRATHVVLTTRGREKFAKMAEVHEGWIDELLGSVNERNTAALITLLASIGLTAQGMKK